MAMATSLLHAARNLGLNVQAGLPKLESSAKSWVSSMLFIEGSCYRHGRKRL